MKIGSVTNTEQLPQTLPSSKLNIHSSLYPRRTRSKAFFNETFSLECLQLMGTVGSSEDNAKVSKSTSYKYNVPNQTMLPKKIQEPTTNQSTQTELLIFSEEIKQIEIPVRNIELMPPPKKNTEKRQHRGEFEEEKIKENRVSGVLKFYRLNKRFGFISAEGTDDLFVCEDDLVLSGVNIKQFKDDVYHDRVVSLSFRVKHYLERGKDKRKAIDLRLIP